MSIYSSNRKTTVALAAVPLLLTAGILLAQSTPNTAGQNSTDKPRLERVHARKLEGFELSRKSSDSATQVAGASRGFGTETTLLAPNKGKAYTLNPLFQWSNANSKIKSYKFRLLTADGKSVLYESEVAGTSLKYPGDAPALKPGSTYSWTVQPSIKVLGEAADPAELVIEGGEDRAKLAAKLTSLPEWSAGRAELFVENRLWYDAIEIYTHLIEANPSDSQSLLSRAELYDQLPQTNQAAETDRSRAQTASR